jgi:O-antigen ligase
LVGPDGSPRPVYLALADWAASLPDAAPVGGYEVENRWATYEGEWRVGALGAGVGRPIGDRATFRFEGTRVALTARRGPHRAFFYVEVDGKPANALPRDETGRAYVVLYDEVPRLVTVPLATGLEPGVHSVEVVAEGGQGQWPLVDWRVGAEPVRGGTSWIVAALAAAVLILGALLFREGRRIDWGALRSSFLARAEWVQDTSVVALTGLLWAAAAVSWGHNLQASDCSWARLACLVVSLLAVPVLGFLLSLRLDLGLALIALLAPFYLIPGTMFYGALGIPEVLIALCVVAYGIFRVARPGSIRSTGDTSALGRGATCEGRRQPRGIDLAVALLVLAAMVSSMAAADRLAALFELRTVILLPALFYVLLRWVPLDGSAWQRIVGGFMLGGVGVALVGLGQWVMVQNLVIAEGGLPRLQSVYPSPNNLGLYLGRVWPLLVAGVLWGERGRRRGFFALALAPVTLALVLSFSRGALLIALPAAVLVMGALAGGRYRVAAMAFVLTVAVALIPLLRLPRFASLLDLEQGSTFFRLKLWRSCLRMIREHPIFGVGPGNFLQAYRTRYILPAAWEEFSLEHPHNVYLDHWTRLGLAGVVAGLMGQIAFWRGLGRGLRGDPLGLGLAGSMAALLVHGLVDNALFFPDLALAFFLMLGLSIARQEPTNEG